MVFSCWFSWGVRDNHFLIVVLNVLFKQSSRYCSFQPFPNVVLAISAGGSAYHLVSEGAVIHVSTMGHFRSCSRRDQLGPFQMSDVSWLTAAPQNPLAVGQYVNNCSYGKLPGKFSKVEFVCLDINYFASDKENQILMADEGWRAKLFKAR